MAKGFKTDISTGESVELRPTYCWVHEVMQDIDNCLRIPTVPWWYKPRAVGSNFVPRFPKEFRDVQKMWSPCVPLICCWALYDLSNFQQQITVIRVSHISIAVLPPGFTFTSFSGERWVLLSLMTMVQKKEPEDPRGWGGWWFGDGFIPLSTKEFKS